MSPQGLQILRHLHAVDALRTERRNDAALDAAVRDVKRFQQQRFERTYADLLADPRHAAAARFFLDELYGPADFDRRDAEFARIVPALVRLFPADVVGTVESLAELHALSERLDTAMARCGATTDYGAAWRRVGEPASRERQIGLMLDIGTHLERYTRNPVLRHSLRLMRAPAQAAGLGHLQRFLETGFETFRAMRGADMFLGTVAQRERELAARLFAGGAVEG